jgi:tripartite-type tricarboxylate transporter receptor subunit TctC
MKFLQTMVLALAICVSMPAWSKDNREEISILWGFNIGSNQANTIRIMTEELNKMQTKYRFSLVSRPGAGGTIAANAVASSPENTVVGMSSSFIIRPYYEKNQGTQNLDNFLPIFVQAEGAPLYLLSAKYKNLREILRKPNASIGVSGIGSISHLTANELIKINPSITVVNFKSMLEAATAAAGGHVDAAIGFYIDTKGLIDDNRLNILGYTGNSEMLGLRGKEFKSYGMPESAKLTANYAIFASRGMSQDRFRELHTMFASVNQRPAVLESYAKDQLIPVKLSPVESEVWYGVQRRYWRELIARIKVQ